MTITKTCIGCKHIKELEAFTKDKRKPMGRTNLCKECYALDKKVARLYALARQGKGRLLSR